MPDKELYSRRREKVAASLRERGVAAARFEDFEGLRSPSLRYLSGHPGDAFLVVSADAGSVLVPWDLNMAEKMASVEAILPYTAFGRSSAVAFRAALEKLGVQPGSKVEMPSGTPYPSFVEHFGALDEWDLLCPAEGADAFVQALRAEKDEEELEIYARASALTNRLIEAIEQGVHDASLLTELDLALFIEREARAAGAEGMGFETLAAGPARSFGIHAFPAYGAGAFGGPGLSILDFGIVVEGYTSDVTMSFAREPLSPKQRRMIELVEEAHRMGVEACGPGVPARDVAAKIDMLFASEGFSMPHALGHGIGLEAHEAPGINLRETNKAILKPGNIVTIEPGLYDPELGGVRLEDDVLITADGRLLLTSSRIVRL
ncbi:MAG: Xaa-Pro peptidase family protein [Spirochaetes bacterium]|nr:Xaa-Pro peptidase family protein [Spirochaetota bacterium]